jgi:hypothetical protein
LLCSICSFAQAYQPHSLLLRKIIIALNNKLGTAFGQ